MKKPEAPIYKPAFLVKSWSDKIIKGFAFNITYVDWYEKKMSFFIENGKDLPFIIEQNQIIYSMEDAIDLLSKEKKSLKEHYKKQLDEYTQKLKSLE